MKRILFLHLVFLFLQSCYSTEFYPEPDYLVLRRDGIEDVDIVYARLQMPTRFVGTLVVREYSGELDDPPFLHMIRGEARKAGASIAWILRRADTRGVYGQADFRGRGNSGMSGGGRRGGGRRGGVMSAVPEVNVLFYNPLN